MIDVGGKVAEVVRRPGGRGTKEVFKEVAILMFTEESRFLLAPCIPKGGEVVKLVAGEGSRGQGPVQFLEEAGEEVRKEVVILNSGATTGGKKGVREVKIQTFLATFLLNGGKPGEVALVHALICSWEAKVSEVIKRLGRGDNPWRVKD
jgi:hypothetical protein